MSQQKDKQNRVTERPREKDLSNLAVVYLYCVWNSVFILCLRIIWKDNCFYQVWEIGLTEFKRNYKSSWWRLISVQSSFSGTAPPLCSLGKDQVSSFTSLIPTLLGWSWPGVSARSHTGDFPSLGVYLHSLFPFPFKRDHQVRVSCWHYFERLQNPLGFILMGLLSRWPLMEHPGFLAASPGSGWWIPCDKGNCSLQEQESS